MCRLENSQKLIIVQTGIFIEINKLCSTIISETRVLMEQKMRYFPKKEAKSALFS